MGDRHTKLTAKMEGAVYSHVMEKMTQVDSYRKHYDVENMTHKTCVEKASILFAKDNMRAREAELREELRKSLEVTREGQVEEYRKLLREAADLLNEEGKASSQSIDLRVKTLARIDKICGLESTTTKMEHDIKENAGIEVKFVGKDK